jgi:hypothetical protein
MLLLQSYYIRSDFVLRVFGIPVLKNRNMGTVKIPLGGDNIDTHT